MNIYAQTLRKALEIIARFIMPITGCLEIPDIINQLCARGEYDTINTYLLLLRSYLFTLDSVLNLKYN